MIWKATNSATSNASGEISPRYGRRPSLGLKPKSWPVTLSRRGGVWFTPEQIEPAPTPLLGYSLKRVVIEGVEIQEELLMPLLQPEIGPETYQKGAAVLKNFFADQLTQYLEPSLNPQGRRIIECALEGGSVYDFEELIESSSFIGED